MKATTAIAKECTHRMTGPPSQNEKPLSRHARRWSASELYRRHGQRLVEAVVGAGCVVGSKVTFRWTTWFGKGDIVRSNG